MKKQAGFSIVELGIILVVIGLIGGVGWYVWQANTKTTQTAQTSQPVTTSEPYSFKELGIIMDLLPGWEVKSNHSQTEGVSFYNWSVVKDGADGSIALSSTGFSGGFTGCAGADDKLTPATITEVSPTQNSNLLFLSWQHKSLDEPQYLTQIVRADGMTFRAADNYASTAIANKDLKAGDYYFCVADPGPGFDLELSKEAATGFVRKDSIRTIPTGAWQKTLEPTATAYADIRTMLLSIR